MTLLDQGLPSFSMNASTITLLARVSHSTSMDRIPQWQAKSATCWSSVTICETACNLCMCFLSSQVKLTCHSTGHKRQAHCQGREAAVPGLSYTAGIHHRDQGEGHHNFPTEHHGVGDLCRDGLPVEASRTAVTHGDGSAGDKAGGYERPKYCANNLWGNQRLLIAMTEEYAPKGGLARTLRSTEEAEETRT